MITIIDSGRGKGGGARGAEPLQKGGSIRIKTLKLFYVLGVGQKKF